MMRRGNLRFGETLHPEKIAEHSMISLLVRIRCEEYKPVSLLVLVLVVLVLVVKLVTFTYVEVVTTTILVSILTNLEPRHQPDEAEIIQPILRLEQ